MKIKHTLRVTDHQVRKLREEMTKNGKIGKASMKAGVCENTARKYMRVDKLPSEIKKPRDWKTRPDPFEKDWAEIRQVLKDTRAGSQGTLYRSFASQSRYLSRRTSAHLSTEGEKMAC
jgi:hypothetical protein